VARPAIKRKSRNAAVDRGRPHAVDLDVAATRASGLRERKKAITRRALEDAALKLFAGKGFDNTTVDEIADACNVSRRTFFRYFASKEEVFEGDKQERNTQMLNTLASRPADEPALASLRVAMLALAADVATERSRLIARMQIINQTPSLRSAALDHEQSTIDNIVDALAHRSRGPVDTDEMFRLRLVAQAATGAVRAAMQRWADNGGKDDIVEVAANALDLLAAAFGRVPDPAPESRSVPAASKSRQGRRGPQR
jgi:AcrR family transcriptional regulator